MASAEILEEPNGFEAEGRSPLVAMDEQGNGIVVWSAGSSLNSRAVARRYTAGVDWSGVEILLENGYPTSVVARNGIVLAALTGPTVDAGFESAGAYAARFTLGVSFTLGGWSTQSVGVTTTGWWQDPYTPLPTVTLGQNAGLVTWMNDHGQAVASVFTDAWQPVQLFGSSIGDPAASMLQSGGFTITWSGDARWDAQSYSLVVSAWNPGSGWLPAATVAPSGCYAKLAASLGGPPHALWSGTDGLRHAEQLPTGEWSAGEMVLAYDHVAYVGYDHLAADRASNALVAWSGYSGTECNSTVAVRYRVEGVGWQETVLLNPTQGERHYQLADLAMAPTGDAWALWRSGSCKDSDREIAARHFDPTTGWGTPVQLDTRDACSVYGGSVAMGGHRTLAAWSTTGTGGIVVRWLE